MTTYVSAKEGPDDTVIYTDESNNKFEYGGGTRAWRNSNPGNMRPGEVSKLYGQIGMADNFAIFPTFYIGFNALRHLLITVYPYMNIAQMVAEYAPATENNDENYESFLYAYTQAPKQLLIKFFSEEKFNKLLEGIQHMEGWTVGIIKELHST